MLVGHRNNDECDQDNDKCEGCEHYINCTTKAMCGRCGVEMHIDELVFFERGVEMHIDELVFFERGEPLCHCCSDDMGYGG